MASKDKKHLETPNAPFKGEMPTPVARVRSFNDDTYNQLKDWEQALAKLDAEFEKPLTQASCLSSDEKGKLDAIKQKIEESLLDESSFGNFMWESSMIDDGFSSPMAKPPASKSTPLKPNPPSSRHSETFLSNPPSTPPNDTPPEIPTPRKPDESTKALGERRPGSPNARVAGLDITAATDLLREALAEPPPSLQILDKENRNPKDETIRQPSLRSINTHLRIPEGDDTKASLDDTLSSPGLKSVFSDPQ